jgi:predicted transcriptional regulator
VQEVLFGNSELSRSPEPVLMSLNPKYYELMWQGLKRHEFRRRYLTSRPTTWYVYLTAPVSHLSAVIDLDEAIADTPQRIADIAEQARAGNGPSVYEYLQELERGFALPITRIREYAGFSAAELTAMLGSFHPPQSYTLVARQPGWLEICEKLTSTDTLREMTVQHPVTTD